MQYRVNTRALARFLSPRPCARRASMAMPRGLTLYLPQISKCSLNDFSDILHKNIRSSIFVEKTRNFHKCQYLAIKVSSSLLFFYMFGRMITDLSFQTCPLIIFVMKIADVEAK